MYQTVEIIVRSGRFALEDLLEKIDILWLQGSLTEPQRLALIQMARSSALPENTYAPLQGQIDALAARVAALEAKNSGEGEDWPQFRQPTGAHDAYRNGDQVTFQGKCYRCVAPEGTAVVWSPEVYPSYWEEVLP